MTRKAHKRGTNRNGALRMSAAFCAALALLVGAGGPATAARVKDIASFEGVRGNILIGYGLVVGLNGSGDGSQSAFTPQSLANFLTRLGIVVDPARVRVRNVAAVMVTAEVPPFARAGRKIDVTVSSIGDAKSLQGGTLLMTPLRGSDGGVFASAQGSVSVGGAFSASSGGATSQRNHPTAGRIPGGAVLERSLVFSLDGMQSMRLLLNDPDFTTASRLAGAINTRFGAGAAVAEDSGGVMIVLPGGSRTDTVDFLAHVEELTVEPDVPARLVFNERTGTVVMGAGLRISRVVISHGNLNVEVETEVSVSQPEPFSQGQTVEYEQPTVRAEEEPARVLILDEGTDIGELVRGLNRIGATARDMIAIFQAAQAAGALQAEIVIQ